LHGTIYWKPIDSDSVDDHPVVKMVKNTADVVEDIWYHCRSKMIQSVGSVGIEEFNDDMMLVAQHAEDAVVADTTFYSQRGVEVNRLELTGKEPVEQTTAAILEQITTMQTDLDNQLAKMITANMVTLAEVTANITLEGEKKDVIKAENTNIILEARMQGITEGVVEVEGVKTYLDSLSGVVTSEDERIALYNMHETMKAQDSVIENMRDGDLKLFMTPEKMSMRMDMSGLKDMWDDGTRRLSAAVRNYSTAYKYGTPDGRKAVQDKILRMRLAGAGNDWRKLEL